MAYVRQLDKQLDKQLDRKIGGNNMFVIKAFLRDLGVSYHAYETTSFQVSNANYRELLFREPNKDTSVCLSLGLNISRIVVENSAGKTVENMAYRPELTIEEFKKEELKDT